jgi:hypothetical protein
MTDQVTEAMMERTFLRACEYAAAQDISMETALTHFRSDTAAALGAYVARRAPELLAQRSPHKDFINQGGSPLPAMQQALPGGHWHPGDEA